MRLFRRTLLCLVVGVMAFGVVGWMLRPKAIWTAPLADVGDHPHFISRADDEAVDDAPVWVVLDSFGDDKAKGLSVHVEARDAKTGQRRTQFMAPYARGERLVALESGQLLVPGAERNETAKTFRFFDADHNEPYHSLSLKGEWTHTSDGRKAWQIVEQSAGLFAWASDPAKNGLKVTVVDPATGHEERSRFLPGYSKHRLGRNPFSKDLKFLAVCEVGVAGRTRPFGVDVIDLDSGKTTLRVPPPPPKDGTQKRDRGLAVGYPSFSADGRFVEFAWGRDRDGGWDDDWRFEIATGKLARKQGGPAVPCPAPDEDSRGTEYSHGEGCDAWLTWHGGPWFLLERDETALHPWTRFPFDLQTDQLTADVMLKFAKVPNCNQAVAFSTEPPLASFVPRALQGLAPESFLEMECRARWHDWDSGAWRDVGPRSYTVDMQARPHSLFTLSVASDGTWLLQSWRLPPRDPRLPALSIAALFAATTWGLCAWRAGTRKVQMKSGS